MELVQGTRNKTLLGFIFAVGLGLSISNLSHAQTPAASGPTDPEIAHIVVTANTIDIDAGKLAQTRAKSNEVKAFAKQMVTDHRGVQKQATDLATKLGVTPKDNDTSKSLLTSAKDNLKKLKGLKGEEFDKAYVNNEVTYHQAVLDALDKTLIPNAKNEELKALMVKVRPAFVAHLEHAKGLQTKLSQ